jgi:hypothetical protein
MDGTDLSTQIGAFWKFKCAMATNNSVTDIQDVSGGIVNILRSGSMDTSE